MKKYKFILFVFVCISQNTFSQLTYQHDIYFENQSSTLSDNNIRTLEFIYKKIPGNATQKINSIGKDEIKYDKNLTELNYTRTWNIIQHLKSIADKTTILGIDTNINYNSVPYFSVVVKKAPIEFEPKYAQLKNVFRKNKHTYTINPNNDATITGVNGTVITFYANTFICSNGKDVKGNININLTEFYSTEDILKAQLTTTSGPLLLETGGMINIKATCSSCAEKRVLIKNDAYYTISFPTTEIKPGMGLFTGNLDEKENLIDWRAAELIENEMDLFENETEYEDEYILSENANTGELEELISTKEEKQLYHTLNSKDFGWINCDRFIDTPMPSNLITTITSPVKLNHVVLVFKNLKSVLELFPDENGKYTAENLPYGEKATLFSYTIANGKTYFSKKEITIGVDNYIELYLTENTLNNFENFIVSL